MGCSGYRAMIRARVDEDLDEGDREALEAHLAGCPGCGREVQRVEEVREALVLSADEEPPGQELLERVKEALAASGATPQVVGETAGPAAGEVLAPEDLAALLRVPVEDVYAQLDELPAFEFAGRIRFRRAAIEAWMEEREDRWRRQALARAMRTRRGPA